MQTSPTRPPSAFGQIGAPFAELDTFVRRLGNSFDRNPPVLDMRMDVEEEDGHFLVSMDIPGVEKSEIDITVSGNVVTVRATADTPRKSSGNGGGKKLHAERIFGESVRSFSLPVDVDPDRTTATYQHGVLRLTLPKAVGNQSRHIRVS